MLAKMKIKNKEKAVLKKHSLQRLEGKAAHSGKRFTSTLFLLDLYLQARTGAVCQAIQEPRFRQKENTPVPVKEAIKLHLEHLSQMSYIVSHRQIPCFKHFKGNMELISETEMLPSNKQPAPKNQLCGL